MRKKIVLILSLIFVASINYAYAAIKGDTLYVDVEFSEPKIIPSRVLPGYDHIEMEGLRSLGNVGEPVLPVKGLKLLIPPQKKVKDIEIILGEKITLPGAYLVEPGQKEYPLSQIGKTKIEPDKPKREIYEAATVYPGKRHKFASLQRKKGCPVAAIELSPVEYNPKKGEISYYKKITVIVKLESEVVFKSTEELKATPRLRIKDKIRQKDKKDIQRLIDNKEDLYLYEEQASTGYQEESLSTQGVILQALGPIPPGEYEYVIITSSSFVSAFEPLKQRKTQNGLPATIVTTDWIYANYPGTRPQGGTDNQTKIRNFIKDAYNNWGTRYVLLAGDGDGANLGGESEDPIIPARGLSDSDDNNIPADLYYACLDGTFDYNANGIYGEKTDGVNGGEIDLLAEVYVGRACVDSAQEATNLVNKTLAYEDTTDSYLNSTYMLGERLGFGGISNYATASMEEIRLGSDAHGYTTHGFLSNPERALDPNTLYDSPDYSWSKSTLVNIISNGVHILNHLGHANNTNNMKLNNSDVDSLANNKYFIAYSQGCYPGAFDNRTTSPTTYITSDCIAEHLTTNSTGAVAFIGNSRYGWGAGNSTAGSSQYYDRQFWDALFSEGITELGRMNQDSKEDNISYLSYGMNRWCYFELNLFGDPALKINLPNPLILYPNGYSLTDAGNGDGLFEPEETIELTITLRALNQDAFNVSAILSFQDSNVTIEQNNASYGIILRGQSIANATSPFRFKISKDCPLYNVRFILTITANGYTKERELLVKIPDPRERRITYNTDNQHSPAISGNYIVWEDWRGNWDIYLYDLTTNTERRITTNTADQYAPAISGNYIVWQDKRNGNSDIYLYDLTTNTERRITTNTADQYAPAISGNYIVWEDERNGNHDIYLYDLSTNTERQITSTNAVGQYTPAISGNYIVYNVWADYPNGYPEIYLYDLITNTERQITMYSIFTEDPAISGNYIVWKDWRGNWDIYLYDLTTNTERRITYNTDNQYWPAISGNYIVWVDYRNDNSDIYLYDLTTNTERRITSYPAGKYSPAISGNYIVWQDERNCYKNGYWDSNFDIYLYNLGDNTPPITPIVTDSGKYTDSTTQLTASWSSSDPESGVVEYQYRILQDSTSGTVVKGWTSTGTATSVTATGLTLTKGKTYYFAVKAKNGAARWSAVGYSDGIIPDSTSPTKPVVTDEGTDTNFSTQLTASWTPSSDPESGVVEYQYRILQDSTSGTVVKGWTSTGTAASVTATGLTLTKGKTYYFAVKAKNGAARWSAVGYSDGIAVNLTTDTTPPTTPVITDEGARTGSKVQLAASWASSDPESGIVEYQYKITQDSPTGIVIIPWTPTSAAPVTATGLTLTRGKTYYFSVKAKNSIGLWSQEGYSDGIKVDFAPAAGIITPSSGTGSINTVTPFATKQTDKDGWQDIKFAYLLVNTSTGGKNCFYAYYDQNNNKLYLRNDANNAWLGGFAPGSNNVIENSYAKLDCSNTTIAGSGNALTINWKVTFKSTFTGLKNTYIKVVDDLDVKTGMVKKGTWTIQ